jgi:hypothetical protein
VFTSKSKFNQSNIGITRENSESIGGLSKVVGAKLFVYYEGSHEELNRQIKEVLSEVMLRKMLFDGNWKDVIKANSFATFPEWYMNGFVSYMSRPWDPDLDAKLKDLLLMQQPLNFSRLEGNDATLIGHAIWHYVEWNFGRDIIPQILYLTRLTRNPNHSFRGVLGVDKSELWDVMMFLFFSRYQQKSHSRTCKQNEKFICNKKEKLSSIFNIQTGWKRIAYIENHLGRYWLKVLDVDQTENKTLFIGLNRRLYREA